MLKRLLETSDGWGLTLARVALGVVFFAHGAQKVLGWWGGHGFAATMQAFTQGMGIPAPLALLALTAEFLGGLGLIVGALTRVAALGIASVMAVALSMHWQHGFFMNWFGAQKGEGFEYHILALALAGLLVLHGAGPLSADKFAAQRVRS